jgi:hypothetical protein
MNQQAMEVVLPLRAWITYRKKDGSGKHGGTLATNPEYVRAHREWHWIEIKLPQDDPQ